MEFKNILKALRDNKEISQRDLANYLKISPSNISMYEKGQRNPDIDTLEAIADYFNVSLDYLRNRDNSIIENVEEIPHTIDLKDLDVKPILHITNFVACCGNGIDFEQLEDTEETIYLPTELVGENTKNSWVMHTIGDSMNKRIPENSNIIVKQNDYYNNGDIVLYKITDNFAIKEYYLYADRIVLKPASYNPLHEQETYNFEDRDNGFEFPEILGKVTGFYGSTL